MIGQELQEGEFARRQEHRLIAAAYRPGGGVDPRAADAHHRRLGLLPTPHQRLEAGQEFVKHEGFAHAVIGTHVEAAHPRVEVIVACNYQDAGLEAPFAPALKLAQTVIFGQSQIKYDAVKGCPQDLLASFIASPSDIHHPFFILQALANGPDQGLVMFDEQNPHSLPPFLHQGGVSCEERTRSSWFNELILSKTWISTWQWVGTGPERARHAPCEEWIILPLDDWGRRSSLPKPNFLGHDFLSAFLKERP